MQLEQHLLNQKPDLENANKAIHKLKSSEVTLKFHNLGDLEKSSIVCFRDAAFANLKNGGSQGAFIIFLYGNKKYAPIAWTSRKFKQVVKSTLPAETLALEESLESCFMIKSLLVKLIGKDNYQNIIPICSYTDNKSLVDTINSTKTLTENWLSQLADYLTKVGASCNKLIHVIQGDGKLL